MRLCFCIYTKNSVSHDARALKYSARRIMFISLLSAVDLCAPSPCQNSGWCERFSDSYVCHCRDGFTGLNCEVADSQVLLEPRCEKTGCLHMRKQRRRSAAQ